MKILSSPKSWTLARREGPIPLHISLYGQPCQANREDATGRKNTTSGAFMPTTGAIEKRLETAAAAARLNRNLAGCCRYDTLTFLRSIARHHHARRHRHVVANDSA